MSSREPHSDITRMMMMRRRSVLFSLHFRSSPLYLFQYEEKIAFIGVDDIVLILFNISEDFKNSCHICLSKLWQSKVSLGGCYDFSLLHWITLITLQLPLCIRLPLPCIASIPLDIIASLQCHSIAHHCIILQRIALDESKRRPRLSHQICCPPLPLTSCCC